MYKSKKFFYEYEQYEEEDKCGETMVPDILESPDFEQLEEIIIGCWGACWDDEGDAQVILDDIVENKEKFSRIKSLFMGDMDSEECEVSWIVQGDYSKLWEAMPQLEKLVIKGSTDLELGEITHENLKHLEIICGGLPVSVIQSIQKAKLPALETLILYIGVEEYGFDGEASDIEALLKQSEFPKLRTLGIVNSEIQDEVTELVLKSKYISQISELQLSMGTLTDKGGQMLLEQLPQYKNVKTLDLSYHYMSEEMAEKLEELSDVTVDVSDPQEPDEYMDEIYYYPMLTE